MNSGVVRSVAGCVLVLFVIGCGGCAGPPSVRATTPLFTSRTAALAAVSTSISVQSLPAYHDAELACTKGDYRGAARILDTLARSAALSAEQRAFCRAQQQICLAHLQKHNPKRFASAGPTRPTAASPRADCGPRALLIACTRLGVPASLTALTKASGAGPRGTSLQGLKTAAQSVLLKAEGVQVGREALPDQPMPAIAWSHGDHFIAVLSMKGRGENGTAVIHDPNEAAERTVSQEVLLQSCSGYLLTLRR